MTKSPPVTPNLGYVSVASLAPGATKTFSKSVRIPTTLAAGSYYLGAIADYKSTLTESDETNNDTASGAVTVYIPTPDLTATAATVNPATVAQRGALALTGTISNVGTGKTGGASYAAFYLSDGVTDTFLKQLSVASTLAAGASVNLSTTYTLPAGFPAGTYTVKLVADYTDRLSEIDETNNGLSGNIVTVLP